MEIFGIDETKVGALFVTVTVKPEVNEIYSTVSCTVRLKTYVPTSAIAVDEIAI